MAASAPLPDALLGRRLHGADLDAAGIAAWFADEQNGYADLVGDDGRDDDAAPSTGHAIRFHALPYLGTRHFAYCLALGAADGREYAPFAGRVDRFVAIEPGRKFWRGEIAGAPADYRLPSLNGTLDLADASCDLAASFGVLHHIPNVAEVLAEVARVLQPGAPFLIREPITSLGDFRRPRPGLTRNERGIPHAMLDAMLAEAGFAVRAKRFVNFPGTRELPFRLGLASAWDNRAIVRLDAALAALTAWNARYWRPRLWDKLAPRSAYWVAERRG